MPFSIRELIYKNEVLKTNSEKENLIQLLTPKEEEEEDLLTSMEKRMDNILKVLNYFLKISLIENELLC